MTYVPIGSPTGVVELSTEYGSGSTVGSTTSSLGTFSLIPNKHIAVRFWLQKYCVRSDAAGQHGTGKETTATLSCPSWVNYSTNLNMYHATGGGLQIENNASFWATRTVSPVTIWVQCHPSNTAVMRMMDTSMQISFVASGVLPSTTVTVQGVGETGYTYNFNWIALLYKKA